MACTVVAIGMVVVDLGNPTRLWELFAYSNMTSPLMWDIVVLGTYLILSVRVPVGAAGCRARAACPPGRCA